MIKLLTCFFVSLSLGSISVVGSDFSQLEGIKFKVNGQEMVYYPSLTISPNNTSKDRNNHQSVNNQGTSSPSSSSSSVASSQQIYGTFHGFHILKRGNSQSEQSSGGGVLSTTQSSSTGLSGQESPTALVTYNKLTRRFGLATGRIQIEVKSGNENTPFELDYDVKILHHTDLYFLVAPHDLRNFIDIYHQLSEDDRVEHLELIFVNPPTIIK